MKKYIFILLMVIFASCKDGEKTKADNVEHETREMENVPPGNIQEERDALQTEKELEKPAIALNGRYQKVRKDGSKADCNCDCINIDFDNPTEWCIVKDKVYISAQSKKTGENTADLYFVDVSKDENADRPLPWDEFDIDQPIASIEFQPDGSAEIDWKGFTTDGKIATDYAIFGKKTIEGTYKKE